MIPDVSMIRRRFRAIMAMRMPGAPRIAALALSLALPLAGCASSPPATYDLSANASARPARALGAQVVVTEPVATAPGDSDRIVVRPTPDTFATLSGAHLNDSLHWLNSHGSDIHF